MDHWRQDVRYAVRALAHAPSFTATVTIVLGIGIGAIGVVFSLINALFLVPPPVRDPARVVRVLAYAGTSAAALTAEEARRIEEESRSIEALAAMSSTRGIVSAHAADAVQPESLSMAIASPRAFEVFDVAPIVGRLFEPADFADAARAPVLIGERVWRRMLNGDPRAIGGTLRVNGEPRTIVGVLPAEFTPVGYELWIPAQRGREPESAPATTSAPARQTFTRSSTRSLTVIARLKPDVGLAQMQEELRAIAQRIDARESPSADQVGRAGRAERAERIRGWTLRAQPVRALFASVPPQAIAWLFAAVAMLWAIACVNVANLVLARGLDRAREASIRAALGATRGRLLREGLTEGVILGLLGGVCGLLCARWSLALVRTMALIPENVVQFGMPRGLDSVRIDPVVFAALFVSTCATVVVFSLTPAWRVARAASGNARTLTQTLALALTQRTAVAGVSRSWRRWTLRDALVLVQIALSVVLLAGAALMLASFQRLAAADRGISLDRVMAVDVPFVSPMYADLNRRRHAIDEMVQQVASVPGIQHAALSSFRLRVPIGIGVAGGVVSDPTADVPSPSAPDDRRADVWTITPDYMNVMGIPLLRGEDLHGAADGIERASVTDHTSVLINRAMARRFWPDRDPIGQSLTLSAAGRPVAGPTAAARLSMSGGGGGTSTASAAASSPSVTSPTFERLIIVGVVGDVRWMRMPTRPLDLDPYPTIYRLRAPDEAETYVRLSLRTIGAPRAAADAVRRAVWRVDRDLPVTLQIADAQLERELARPRFNLTLAAAFAVLALLLAIVGVYSVVAGAVARSRREIALRLALGARRADVFTLVFAWAGRLAIVGVAIGAGLSLAMARIARSQLFEVSATDPRMFAGAASLVLVAIAVAVWLPARRAARVEPARALAE